MIDLTGIAVALLSLLAAWITTSVIPWIKARTTSEQRRVAQIAVRTAVYAAEQLYKGDGKGEEKLRYVRQSLANAGIKLDVDAIRQMIEEAVLELSIRRDWAFVGDEPEAELLDGQAGDAGIIDIFPVEALATVAIELPAEEQAEAEEPPAPAKQKRAKKGTASAAAGRAF